MIYKKPETKGANKSVNFSVEMITDNGVAIVSILNNSKKAIEVSKETTLEFKDRKWIVLGTNEHSDTTVLNPTDCLTFKVDLTKYGEIRKGDYRFKNNSMTASFTLENDFVVEEF